MFKFMPPNEVISEDESNLSYKIVFPKDYEFYKGHFPDFSLLPGMIQVHLAIEFAREKFNLKGEFSGFKSIKFSKPLTPNKEVYLELSYLKGDQRLDFLYKENEDDFYSKGSIRIS